MKVKEVADFLNALAPPSLAEDFDNVGLLVGNYDAEVHGVLVALDTTEQVLEEAKRRGCNMIVSFHPIIFSGLKKLTYDNYVERVVIKSIKEDIAIFAIHTAFDNVFCGTNSLLCEALGLLNPKMLIAKKNILKKLTTFIPLADLEKVRNALFQAGAGNIGNYEECSFSFQGNGTFTGKADSKPVLGKKGERYTGEEFFLSVVFESFKEGDIKRALLESHPYEEVAYEIISLDNNYQKIGMGMMAELQEPMLAFDFLRMIKDRLNIPMIRHSAVSEEKKISKVAVLGGSGSFAFEAAASQGADVFLTADLKYHNFFQGNRNIILADIGHYESEQFIEKYLVKYLAAKMPRSMVISAENSNPVYYL